MRRRPYFLLGVAWLGLPMSAVGGSAVIVPAPRIGEWLAGTGSLKPLTIETAGKLKSTSARALWHRYAGRLPKGRLPAEGYLLAVNSKGATAVVADATGRIRLTRTLRQLDPDGSGSCPNLRIADWPDLEWRGLHVLDSGGSSMPQVLRLIRDILPQHKANVLIYEIDYNFQFTSDPAVTGGNPWTRTQIGALVQACREEGIRLIPEINCLGHQSWKQPPGDLLRAHPELEEIPDGRTDETDLAKDSFYCRSWCILNPDTNRIVLPLIDELIDAFQADAFHVGMDEVFVIASEKCPRCKGKDPAELFAKQVNDFHAHLKKRKVQMFMWPDRLLDGKATGYGAWAGAENGTAKAIGMIPKDIIMCDWHYDYRESYPSLKIFPEQGFTMWPTIYSDLRGARKFMADAKAANNPARIKGVLTSIWIPANQMAFAQLDDAGGPPQRGAKTLAHTAVTALDEAWSGVGGDLAMTPDKPTFLEPIEVAVGAVDGHATQIRYTLDGTLPTLASPIYTAPIRLEASATVTAAEATADGVSMRTITRRFERLELMPVEAPAAAGRLVPGLSWASYRASPPGFEKVADLDGKTPAKTGNATGLDLAVAGHKEHYGLVFTGWIRIPADGLYVFTLSSDDGSQLMIDGRRVVNADGLHQANPETGEAALAAGLHRIRIPFIQAAGGASLELKWKGPGMPEQVVPASAFLRE